MTKPTSIKIELTDAGRLISLEKYSTCFVTRNVVDQQLVKMREKVQGLICFDHAQFPEANLDLLGESVCIKIDCCCETLFHTVDQRFSGK